MTERFDYLPNASLQRAFGRSALSLAEVAGGDHPGLHDGQAVARVLGLKGAAAIRLDRAQAIVEVLGVGVI